MFDVSRTDALTKRIDTGAFLQPVRDLHFGATRAGNWPIQRTENHHRNVTGRRLGAQDLAHHQAVQVRQHHIENNDVGRLASGFAQGLETGGGPEHLESLAGQLEINQVQNVGLIIHNQHARLHTHETNEAR